MGRMFTVEQRERVRADILRMARSDSSVISGATVGSDASGRGDRWSDLDLTFGIRDDAGVVLFLDGWTRELGSRFGAIPLFDVTERKTVYRVFLLPGNLQVDLSATPGYAAQYGPKFRLEFGEATRREDAEPRSSRDAFGYGAHHAVRARFSLERQRPLQAEYWISGVRHEALSVACLRRGIQANHGRGFDQLPDATRSQAEKSLAKSLGRAELLRSIGVAVDLLLREAGGEPSIESGLSPQLRDLARPDWD